MAELKLDEFAGAPLFAMPAVLLTVTTAGAERIVAEGRLTASSWMLMAADVMELTALAACAELSMAIDALTITALEVPRRTLVACADSVTWM